MDNMELDEDNIQIQVGDRPEYGLPSLTEEKQKEIIDFKEEDEFSLAIVPNSGRASDGQFNY